MGGAVAEGAQKVNRAAEYRARMRRKVTLPGSGMEVEVRSGSLTAFIYGGSLPAPMLSVIQDMASGQKAGRENEPELARLMDLVLVHYVVDPMLVAPVETGGEGQPGVEPVYHYTLPDLKEGELGTWELLDADKFELFGMAMSDAGLGATSAASFRAVPAEQGASADPGPGSTEVSPASE